MLPKHSLNFLTFQNFQQTCFCVMSEKIITLHHFLTAKNCIFEAFWKQMSVYFYTSPLKNCFRDVVRFYLEDKTFRFHENFRLLCPFEGEKIRSSYSKFMTKKLYKEVMKRSRLRNKYYKNCICENLSNYKKQRNICTNILKKTKTN